MFHGNYESSTPPPRPRHVVLQEFGLKPGTPVVSCLGNLRAYKGLELAVKAASELGGDVQLLIGGKPHPGVALDSIKSIKRERGADDGVVIIARQLSAQEFSDALSVSEAVLLPYRNITTSGALLAAWTQGCGVIASDLPYFRELLENDPAAGMLFPCGDAPELAKAIARYISIPAEQRRAAALRSASLYPWDKCIRPVAAVLRSWSRGAATHARLTESPSEVPRVPKFEMVGGSINLR
ncbi:MAG TPA: glycosyltransferase [Candidatus Binatia bacterium]|nr:glycosyltransferase [Candidatus Binatia bacterium]